VQKNPKKFRKNSSCNTGYHHTVLRSIKLLQI